MGVGGQRHARAPLPPGKRSGTHFRGGWVGPTDSLTGHGKSRPPPGFDPRTVQPVASRYTDWAISARTQPYIRYMFLFSLLFFFTFLGRSYLVCYESEITLALWALRYPIEILWEAMETSEYFCPHGTMYVGRFSCLLHSSSARL